MNTFRTRSAAPALIAALCLLTTVAGCQSHKSNVAPGANLGQGLSTATLTDASFGGMPATQVGAPRVGAYKAAWPTPPAPPFRPPPGTQSHPMATAR